MIEALAVKLVLAFGLVAVLVGAAHWTISSRARWRERSRQQARDMDAMSRGRDAREEAREIAMRDDGSWIDRMQDD